MGLPLLDHGLGVAAAAYSRDPDSPDFTMHHKFHLGPPDLQTRIDRAAGEWPREVYGELMRPGLISTLSDVAADHPICLESYARHVHGDSVKMIGYRLGISNPMVSNALKRAMRKLGVRTRAQLIERFGGFQRPAS